MAEITHEHPERLSTDTSLQTEREKTDDQLGSLPSVVEKEADARIRRARERADRVLASSRRAEDRREGATSKEVQEAVDEQRHIADAVTANVRTVEDDELEARRDQARIVQELLRMEREETDEQLLIERNRIDWLLSSQDDFLAMVTHDLRSLLTNVALASARIIQSAPLDMAGQRIVGHADKSQWAIARAQRILIDLTDVAAISSGKLRVEPREGDLVNILQEVAQSFQPLADTAGIVLQQPASSSPVKALFDPDRLAQVLANLLSNALKFTPRGGIVTLGTTHRNGMVAVQVRDTGPGVPTEKQEMIFERFKQVSSDRRGLGMGLYIARMIVEAQGGRIWVQNGSVSGCTFHFTLRPA